MVIENPARSERKFLAYALLVIWGMSCLGEKTRALAEEVERAATLEADAPHRRPILLAAAMLREAADLLEMSRSAALRPPSGPPLGTPRVP